MACHGSDHHVLRTHVPKLVSAADLGGGRGGGG